MAEGVADAFIEDVGEDRCDAVLEEVEWEHGEDHQRQGVVDPWVDGVAHADDGFQWQTVEARVHWQHDVGVEKDVDDADDDGRNRQGCDGAALGVLAAIDEGRREDEAHAADEV